MILEKGTLERRSTEQPKLLVLILFGWIAAGGYNSTNGFFGAGMEAIVEDRVGHDVSHGKGMRRVPSPARRHEALRRVEPVIPQLIVVGLSLVGADVGMAADDPRQAAFIVLQVERIRSEV